MAESKFLKYQDNNNDGLIDVCETEDIVTANNCPPCKRNPNAIVPSWKKQETDDPWFNAKYCTMQCTVKTTIQNIIPPSGVSSEENMNNIFEQYEITAIKSLFEKFNKLESEETIEELRPHIQYTKYFIKSRPNSYLKLLYSIPVDKFALIQDAVEPSEEDTDEEDTGPIVISYKGDELFTKLMKFRKGMYLFSRYYRVFQAVEGGLYYFEDGSAFTTKKFDRYGDPGFFGMFGKSVMANILTDLDDWLNTKGYNIFGAGAPGLFKPRVTELEFTFTSEYKLNKLKVYTAVCGRKPTIYKSSSLETLNNKSSFKDKTAISYFTKLNEIESFLGARVERPWTEFIEKYTYPKITSSSAAYGPVMTAGDPTIGSCIVDNLLEEGKKLGQDVLDDVFSLGDAIAYQFHKNTCKKSLMDVDTELEKMGLIMNEKNRPELFSVIDPKTNAKTNVFSMANAQAFETLEKDNNIFTQMCAAFIGSQVGLGGDPDKQFRELWRDGFSRVKLCGLMDFMVGALQCLFGGLTLEQALAKALESTLTAMSIDNFEDMFIGLPPEKQAELDALVKKKFAAGQLPGARDSNMAQASRALDDRAQSSGQSGTQNPDLLQDSFSGDIAFSQPQRPWLNKEFRKAAKEQQKQGNNGEAVASYREIYSQEGATPKDFRTIGQRLDKGLNGGAQEQLDPNSVMQAYIAALIEVYSEDLLSLVDMLNQYPGAEIIAKIIAVFDCPRPPMFEPSFMDFIKSVDLPFCSSIQEIQIPKFVNPFAWINDFTDIMKAIYYIILLIVQRAIMAVIMRLLVKVCQIIGDAICKALEATGSYVASLAFGPPTQIKDVIREAICGGTADDSKVDATIADMFAKFGVGGAALSDSEAIKNFVTDLSSSVSRREVAEAVDGRASEEFQTVAYELLVNQYPQFADAFPSPQDLADLFTNIGNLMPMNARANIQAFLDELPEDDFLPANPSLCSTPEQQQDFKDRYCMLLEGTATAEDCDNMFSGLQDDFLEDLEQVSNAMNHGVGNAVMDEIGPLVSEPGCDDGVFPFETEEAQKAANQALSKQFQQLHGDFCTDMLGNGGLLTFFGSDDADWGLMNMILSDTKGKPLSTHRRKAFRKSSYVDVATKQDFELPEDIFLFFKDDTPPTVSQEGQFPAFVAEDLFFTMKQANVIYKSKNEQSNVDKAKVFKRTFEELGFNDGLGLDVDVLVLPDFGYNAKFDVEMDTEKVVITKGARKKSADIKLSYEDKDNSKDKDLDYEYAIDVRAYFSDFTQITGSAGEKLYVNRPDDNVRIKVNERTKLTERPNTKPENQRLFEFLSVDDSLQDIELSQFTKFSEVGKIPTDYAPQVLLLSDVLNNNGASVDLSLVKTFHDNFMSIAFNTMLQEIAGPEDTLGNPTKAVWQFGAKIDDLTEEDLLYVVNKGQTKSAAGTEYADAQVTDYDEEGKPNGGSRDIENDDMILGISHMQHKEKNQGANRENRVFFLDPKIYGGSYMKPKIFIKPVKTEGWLGMVDVIFPEAGPCKPQLTDLIDFKEIEEEISRTYAMIPEDQRLKYEEKCVVEYPFFRVLNRNAKAGIQGLIKAAARIYSSVHFIKGIATFTTFNTEIKDNYSSLFASYVVENMERDFKDAQGAVWEFFNPFKDEEFWYAFLEQTVQTYGRLIDDENLEPPPSVQTAIDMINNAQEKYNYPFYDDLKAARETRRAQKLQTLKNWREERKYEAIKKVEDQAKLVLKEFVRDELNIMAAKFNKNLDSVGIKPQVNDVQNYFLTQFAQGAEELSIDKVIKEETVDMPTSGSNHYTNGNEMSTPDGESYIGYYHVHIDEDGNQVYMVGESHSTEAHDELTLYADKKIIPIGDIKSINVEPTYNASKPFVIRKYTSINGTKYDPDEAAAIIRSNPQGKNISDIYPGTLDFVYAEEQSTQVNYGDAPLQKRSIYHESSPTDTPGPTDIAGVQAAPKKTKRIVGLEGKLGVRHGLIFEVYIVGHADPYTIANVEVDALDLDVSKAQTIEPNSKLLYCLINNLKDDEIYKAVTNYVIPLNKISAILAIYNDASFLPSIGQISVEKGDNNVNANNIEKKPGIRVYYVDDDPEKGIDRYEYTPGWEHYEDRKPSKFPNFVREWDEWDKILLRNSKSRIKKMFKTYYNSRDWQTTDDDFDAARILMRNLKSNLTLPAGAGLLSWWQRSRLLRTNPLNAEGKLCTKKD